MRPQFAENLLERSDATHVALIERSEQRHRDIHLSGPGKCRRLAQTQGPEVCKGDRVAAFLQLCQSVISSCWRPPAWAPCTPLLTRLWSAEG